MNYKKVLNNLKNESGQMLLFVVIILLLLLIIVIAIVVNVKSDMRATQLEREYEQAYSFTEGELLNILDTGYTTWKEQNDYSAVGTSSNLNKFCPTAGCTTGNWSCVYKGGFGDDSNGVVLVKTCEQGEISDYTILKDETLEVNLLGYSGNISIANWTGANTLMVIMVYTNSLTGEYRNIRWVACRTADANFPGCELVGTKNFNTSVIPSGFTLRFMRIRALGGDAVNIDVSGGASFPVQATEIRVQGFTEDVNTSQSYKELSSPELVAKVPAFKQLPSIFDYVLFSADGDVSK